MISRHRETTPFLTQPEFPALLTQPNSSHPGLKYAFRNAGALASRTARQQTGTTPALTSFIDVLHL